MNNDKLEFKGTAGVWQVVDDYDDYHEYSVENPQMYIWNGDEQADSAICDMGQMGDFNYAECLANAKLIAASPDLLHVCQKILELRALIEYDTAIMESHEGEAIAIQDLMKLTEEAINKALK